MKLPDHKDYYNKNKKKLPSVTTIIGLLNKPQLVPWANMMGFKKINTTKLLENSAQMGTAIHYTIERLCKHKPTSLKDLDMYHKKKIKTGVKSFKVWYKDKKPAIIENELRLQCDEFGGTIDCICKIDDEIYMVDFKTSKQAYATYFLQLAGYNYLCKENGYRRIDKVAILVLNKDNIGYKFKIMDTDYLEEFYEPVFLLLLEVYKKWKDVLYWDWTEFI